MTIKTRIDVFNPAERIKLISRPIPCDISVFVLRFSVPYRIVYLQLDRSSLRHAVFTTCELESLRDPFKFVDTTNIKLSFILERSLNFYFISKLIFLINYVNPLCAENFMIQIPYKFIPILDINNQHNTRRNNEFVIPLFYELHNFFFLTVIVQHQGNRRNERTSLNLERIKDRSYRARPVIRLLIVIRIR